MRGVAVVLSVGVLAAACSGAVSKPPPTPSPSPTSTLARGAVPVAIVHTCGAGGRQCPSELTRLVNRGIEQHQALPFATPDTLVFPSQGCGGALRAPFGKAVVGDQTIRWRADWVGAGPDCFGPVIGFVRFARPVYDMHSPVKLVTTWTNVGKDRHVDRSAAYAAPELARWVNPEWQPATCRRCNPTPGPDTG